MFPWTDPPEPLRFDRFMAAALHDPVHGYYGRRIRSVGRRGDFSTTATLSPSLGKAIAAWADEAMPASACRNLIELGPGTGALASSVLANLPWLRRARTKLHLVESSPGLREEQMRKLGSRARWHDTLADALEVCGGSACIFSNEFVDAFPVRRFRQNGGCWEESHVLPAGEIWTACVKLPSSSAFNHPFTDGQVVEVHESYHDWMASSFPSWKSGRMLTIDYGAGIDRLYQRQPGGSLRAYFHHQCLTGRDALERPGHQDLTCDVNFTDLIEWSRPWTGSTRLSTQRDFLLPFVSRDNPADLHAVDPHGAGGAFFVLESVRA